MKKIKIMKTMTKQFFAAAVALLAFNACSDSYLAESDNVIPEPTPAKVSTVNSAVLTDANGQPVKTLSPNFGTYYLDIKTDGLWYIETADNMEFTPTKMYGYGSMRVPVLVANNWAGARELSYKVKFLNGTSKGITRGPGDDGDGDNPDGDDGDNPDGDDGDNPDGGNDKAGSGDNDNDDKAGSGDNDDDDDDDDKDKDNDGDNDKTPSGNNSEDGQTVIQDSRTSLANFEKIVNSNLFVGYGYNPTKNAVPELCTGIEIFKMDSLNETNIVKSSLSPQAKEMYYYADSEDDMDKVVAVKANPGGNFNVVKFDLKVDVNKTDITRHGSITVQKSLTRSVYGREMAWANVLVNDKNFSEGFKYYKQRYINQLKNAKDTVKKVLDTAKVEAATSEFLNIVGTHFISKALLGCELNYRMTVDSTKATHATSVKAALDFKWQQQVRDTTKVDEEEEEEAKKTIPDSLRKNFVFGAKVSVTDSAYNAASSTKASVKARGGDVERVNILTTGGTLVNTELAAWLLSTDAEKATMVGINTLPIYVLFKDDEDGPEKDAHDYLQKIIDANFSLDPSKYGVINDQ